MGTAVVWRWSVAGLFALVCALGACGLEQQKDPFDDDRNPFSASILENAPDNDEVFGNTLTPAERAALARSHAASIPADDSAGTTEADPEAEQSDMDKKLDTAGKMGLSFLTVGLSLAAAAAPFFLF